MRHLGLVATYLLFARRGGRGANAGETKELPMTEPRETGTVKMYNPDRGFGFIARERGEDVFVSQREIDRASLGTLSKGDRVSFAVRRTDRGWQAEQLARLDASGGASHAPGAPPPDTTTDFQFGPEYLAQGYFELKDDKRSLRSEIVDALAQEAAKRLGNQGMKTHQIRRVFNKARGIQARLKRDRDFAATEGIYKLKRDVAYQVGRAVVPEDFLHFIERNVALAVADRESFEKGFMQHFESILAYFVYYFRD